MRKPVSGTGVGVPYVLFAGNVGDDDALAAVVGGLHRMLLPDGDGGRGHSNNDDGDGPWT